MELNEDVNEIGRNLIIDAVFYRLQEEESSLKNDADLIHQVISF